MFEYIYSRTRVGRIGHKILKQYLSHGQIVPLLWTEHCVECAAPLCYATCPRYRRRSDGHCVRVAGGITPVETDGQIGARVELRTWAKIEAEFTARPISSRQYARLYALFTRLGYILHALARTMPTRRLGRTIDNDYMGHGNATFSPYADRQLRVPLLVWLSPSYREACPDMMRRIRRAGHYPVTTDDISHTLLDIAGIHTSAYAPERSFINDRYDTVRHRTVLGNVDWDAR